jgi:hypothetical protein
VVYSRSPAGTRVRSLRVPTRLFSYVPASPGDRSFGVPQARGSDHLTPNDLLGVDRAVGAADVPIAHLALHRGTHAIAVVSACPLLPPALPKALPSFK